MRKSKNIKVGIHSQKIMKGATGWFPVIVDVFMTNVLCFVGSRKNMLDTLFDAPVMKNLPHDDVVEIGGEIATMFDSRCNSVAGEAMTYGDIQFIRIVSFDGSVSDICVLAHECLHVAEHILRNMAIKEQENRTSELLAYLQEHIFKSLLMQLYKSEGFDVVEENKIG